jgi:hypothetical protein
MITIADINAAADEGTNISSYVDSATPAGFFGVTAKILGIVRSYLLEGELDDPNAESKGSVVIDADKNALAYRGKGLIGGTLLGRVESYEKSFAEISGK